MNNSTKVVVTLLITSIYKFILIYVCLLEVDLESVKVFLNSTSENLGIFFNLCTNSIIK